MLLQRLRNETARNHAAIESQMPLLDPSLSLEMYRDLLARFRGFYVPLEQQLQSRINKFWSDTEYVWAEREKSPLLEFDLRTMGQITSADDECLVLPSLKCSRPFLRESPSSAFSLRGFGEWNQVLEP